MAFKMRSGNAPKFKAMGSSPVKKHILSHGAPRKTVEDYLNEGFSQREADQMYRDGGVTGHVDTKTKNLKDAVKAAAVKGGVPKPKKSTTTKHGQLNDAQLEYETDKKLYEKSKKKKSPAKQTTDPKKKKKKTTTKTYSLKDKTFPPEYTAEDIKFLEEQREDIVRRSDFPEGSKEQKMFDANQAKIKAKKAKKKKSPAKAKGGTDPKKPSNKKIFGREEEKVFGGTKVKNRGDEGPTKKDLRKANRQARKAAKTSPAKMNGGGMPVKTKGLGPRASFGGVKNPELNKKNKEAKKTKEKKVFKDGPKNRVHYKGKIVSQEDWRPAYPGADYSKKEIAKMTEQEKARKIDGYTPKNKK